MPDPCQVDFYVLEDETQRVELLACRLAMMAWQKGNRIMLLTESEAENERLDQLLWEHPQGRFLPHAKKHEGEAPVLIGTLAQLGDNDGNVVINLTREPVPAPQRFQRLLELVPASPSERAASREKFRAYREQGLNPESHSIKQN